MSVTCCLGGGGIKKKNASMKAAAMVGNGICTSRLRLGHFHCVFRIYVPSVNHGRTIVGIAHGICDECNKQPDHDNGSRTAKLKLPKEFTSSRFGIM